MKKVNERIKSLREDNDLTQQKVADILHVSQRTYSDYETDKVRITVECLITLAKFYDVSLDYLSGCSNVKKSFPKK